jgi:hypothetical protein
MPGIQAVKRSIQTKVMGDGREIVLNGTESWKAYQPFSLQKIEHIQFELTLAKDDLNSCQIHVEFRKKHIFLSVSDHGTGWLDAMFEEMERTLKSNGLFKGELAYKLTSTILRLQTVFLVVGAALILLPIHYDLNLFYVGLSLTVTGIVPVFSDIYRIFSPQKPIQVLEEKPSVAIVNIEKIAIWVSLISGAVTLVKELVILVSSSGM